MLVKGIKMFECRKNFYLPRSDIKVCCSLNDNEAKSLRDISYDAEKRRFFCLINHLGMFVLPPGFWGRKLQVSL